MNNKLPTLARAPVRLRYINHGVAERQPAVPKLGEDVMDLVEDFFDHLDSPHGINNDHTLGSLIPKNSSTPKNRDSPLRREMGNQKPASGNESMRKTVLPKVLFGEDGSCCSHQEQTQQPKPVVEVVCASPADSVITSVLKDDKNENSLEGSPLLLNNQTESPKKTSVLPAAVLKRLTFNDTEAPPLESVSSPSKRQNKETSDTPTPAKKQMLVISPTSNAEENMEPDNPDASLLKVSEKVKEKSIFLQIIRKNGLSEKGRKKHLVPTPPRLPQTDLGDDDFIEKDPEDFAFHSWITIPKKKKDPPVQPTPPEQNRRDQKKINEEPAATKANKNQVEAKQQNTEAAAKKKEDSVMKKVPLSKITQKESSEKHSDSDAEGSLKVINNLQQTETNVNKKKSNQARVQYKKTKVIETKRKNTVEMPKSMKSKSVDSECGNEEALCVPQLSPEDVQPVRKQDGSCCSHQEQTQNPKPVVEVVCASPADSAITSVLKDDKNENSIKGSPLLVKNQTESKEKTFVLPAVVLKRLTFNDTEAPPLESFSSQSKRQNKETSDTPTTAKKQMLVIMSPNSNEEENMEPDNPDASLLKVSEKVKEKSRFLQILRKTGLSEKRRKKPLVLTPPKLPQTDLVDDDFIEKDPEDFAFHSWITIPKKKKDPPVQPTSLEQNRRDQKKINEEPAATKANKYQVEAKQQNTEAAAKKKEDIVLKKVPLSNKKRKESSEKHNESDAEEGSLEVINNLQQTETNPNKKRNNQAKVQFQKTEVTETKRKKTVEVPKSVKSKSVDFECGNEEALCVPQLSPEDVQPVRKKGKTIKKTNVNRRKNSQTDKAKKSSLPRADSSRRDPSSALLRSMRLRRTPSTWWAVKSDSQEDVEGGLSITCSSNRDPSPSPPLSEQQSTSPAKNMKINATGRKKGNKRRSSSGPQYSERDSSEYTLDDQAVKGSLTGPGMRKNILKDKANKSSCSSDGGNNSNPSLDTSCSKQPSRLPVKSKKTDVKRRNGQANKGRARTSNSSRPLNSVRSLKNKLNKESKQRSLSSASAGSNSEPSPGHSRTSSRQKTGPRTWWIVKSDEDTLKNFPEKTKPTKASRQLTPRPGKTPKSILKKNYCQSTRSTDDHESTAEEDDDSEEEKEVVEDGVEEEVNKEADDTVFFKLAQNQPAAVQRKSRLPSFKESLALGRENVCAPSNFKTSLASFGVACAPTPVPSRGKSGTNPVPSISKGLVTIRSPLLSARASIHKNDPKSISTPQLQRDLETDSDSRSEGDFYLEGVAPLSDTQMEQFHSGAVDGASENEEQGIPSQGSLRSTFTLSENSVTNLGQHHNSGPDLRRSVPAVKGGPIHFEDLTSVLPTNTPGRRSEKRKKRVDYRITQPGDFIADEILSPERELQQSSQNHASTRGTYQNLISGTLSTEMMAKLYRWLCGPGELDAQGNYNEIKTKLQDENGRIITVGCVKSIDMHNFKWYTLSNNYMGISRELTEPTFTHGKVLLGPFMEKPCQYVHTNTMVLNVVTGSVNVYIHLSQYQLSTGSVFYVPPGNIYGVVNITDQPALLYFTEIKVR
ncbi:centromere protein C-like [Acipenser ruthenus]|uniref:centromere protein C-like n=1 Tax=Acipenser ruthenus TaxID=7906 RepID=UPI002741A6DA|nr:centromere protein C-like [Acipenser ruthenus]